MEIKITGAPNDLLRIHELIYEKDKNIEVDEEYGPNEGYQKEPLVIALITGATSIVTAIITNFIATKSSKRVTETEKYKIDKENETQRLKILIKENRKWKELEIKELELIINNLRKDHFD